MDNHIHLLITPLNEDSLRKGIGEEHRLYTRYINFRVKIKGHLFQGRFYSCPLENSHLLAAARYVERNPVRARLSARAEDYPWSSARFHLGRSVSDPLIRKKYELISQPDDWADWLSSDFGDIELLRHHFKVGRPLGSESFIRQAELTRGRSLLRKRAGRPKRIRE